MPVQPFSDSNGVFAELSFSPLEGGDAGATQGLSSFHAIPQSLSVPSKAGMPVQPANKLLQCFDITLQWHFEREPNSLEFSSDIPSDHCTVQIHLRSRTRFPGILPRPVKRSC